MPDVPSLFNKHMQQNDPTGWFEELYANAQQNPDGVPWAHLRPNVNLTTWQAREQHDGCGTPALVIGCGLGDDAEYIAKQMNHTVTAFDISQSAIDWCHQRWAESPVTYQVADLFALPEAWLGAFDFVFESYTVQALPPDMHAAAMRHVAATVKPGGQLLFVCMARDEAVPPGNRPPWVLARSELAALEDAGLTVAAFENYVERDMPRFRVLYQRPA